MLKEQIAARGLKLKWIAEKIGVNYASFRVYINNEALMPEQIKKAVKELIA